MTDPGFVLAAYLVIGGVLALYAITLLRRLRSAREESLRIRRAATAGPDARDETP